MNRRTNLDLAGVHARLDGVQGRDYWRSLDELASTPEFRDLLEREFPHQAIGWSDDEDAVEGRRNFLKLMGASLALAGLTACTRQPTEHIMPYVRQPEELIPGRPLFFATAMILGGVANGRAGGKPRGPSYQDRRQSRNILPRSALATSSRRPRSCNCMIRTARKRSASKARSGLGAHFLGAALRSALRSQQATSGGGIRILTETITSPTMANQFAAIQKLYPAAKWHQWEPAGPHQRAVPPCNPSASPSIHITTWRKPTSWFLWIRISWPRARQPPVCAPICRSTPRAKKAVRG